MGKVISGWDPTEPRGDAKSLLCIPAFELHSIMTKQRGNPNWGRATGAAPVSLSEFEKTARKLGLEPHQYVSSPQLRAWAERNCRSKFVPEALLKAWGLDGSALPEDGAGESI